MTVARREDRIDGYLDVTVGSVLDPNRHREAAHELAMDLAFGRASTDGAPTDRVRIELTEGGIEKFRASRQPERRNVDQKLARQAQPVIDAIAPVEIRIVDQPFPTDHRPWLFEVHAHDDEQIAGITLHDAAQAPRVLEPCDGVVNRTRTHDDEQPR